MLDVTHILTHSNISVSRGALKFTARGIETLKPRASRYNIKTHTAARAI
jgi:hypothetical protein